MQNKRGWQPKSQQHYIGKKEKKEKKEEEQSFLELSIDDLDELDNQNIDWEMQ